MPGLAAWPGRQRNRSLRVWGTLGLCAFAVVLALLFARTIRLALAAALLLPSIFPGVPLDPLAWLTPEPRRSEHQYTYAAGTVEADLYHPGTPGRHGGVVLLLGARPLPKRDDLLVRFASSLAREGVLVLIPESSNLAVGRILPEELDALAKSFDLLAAQPDADPTRLGFVGFSVGGGLSVRAATEAALRGRVRFVNAFGAYADAEQLLVDVASRSIVVDGLEQPWEPAPLSREILALQLVETLDDPRDQALLDPLSEGSGDAPEPAALTGEGRAARTLLLGATRMEAQAAVALLSPRAHDRLTAISPASTLADLHARLFLMHDRADTYIPFTQSRYLAAHAPPATHPHLTEFNIFQHVVPDRPVAWPLFLDDLWALFLQAQAVLGELL